MQALRIIFLHLLLLPFISVNLSGQILRGTVYSLETRESIDYVNIGIIGKDRGTVSTEFGDFELAVDSSNYADSIRFSFIGLQAETYLIQDLIKLDSLQIFMTQRQYDLKEATIKYDKQRSLVLGLTSSSFKHGQGFVYSSLGAEMGIAVDPGKKVLIRDINFLINNCPFDTVEYRLNIYNLTGSYVGNNILKEPVYLKFSCNEAGSIQTFDLRKYNIIIKGPTLITLELFRELGEGKIIFQSNHRVGLTWFKGVSEGTWKKSPGLPVFYLNGTILKQKRSIWKKN